MRIWGKKFQASGWSAGASGKERFLIHLRISRRLVWLGQRGSVAGASREVMGRVMSLEPTLTFSSPPPLSPHHQLLRKRHIGNDIVTIIFQEPGALPFTPKNIRSHFQHVFIIVRAHNPCTDNVCYRYMPRPPPARTGSQESWLPAAGERGGRGSEGTAGPGRQPPTFLVRASVGELYSFIPTPPEKVVLNQKWPCHPSFDKETTRNLFLPGVFSVASDRKPTSKRQSQGFPGSPVVKTVLFQCRGHTFDPWSGN